MKRCDWSADTFDAYEKYREMNKELAKTKDFPVRLY